MNLSPPAYALLGVLATALVTLVIALLRNSRKSPEQRAATSTGWQSMTTSLTGLSQEVTRLMTRMTEVETTNSTLVASNASQARQLQDQALEIAELKSRLGVMTREATHNQVLLRWYRARVAQLAAFIIGKDLVVPEPLEPEPVP